MCCFFFWYSKFIVYKLQPPQIFMIFYRLKMNCFLMRTVPDTGSKANHVSPSLSVSVCFSVCLSVSLSLVKIRKGYKDSFENCYSYEQYVWHSLDSCLCVNILNFKHTNVCLVEQIHLITHHIEILYFISI